MPVGQRFGGIGVVGPDQHHAPAVDGGNPLALQPLDQVPGVMARSGLHADLVQGIALLGGLGPLVGDPLGVLGRRVLGIHRTGIVGRLPALRNRLPVRQLDVGLPSLVGDQPLDQALRGLALGTAAGVTEHVVAVDGDDDLVVEGALEVVLELLGLQRLAEAVREAVVVQVDVQAPVVVHRL